jgi:hypothetical protein
LLVRVQLGELQRKSALASRWLAARSFASLPASSLRAAFERANTLAKGSGSRVGALQSASQGVIKILARGEIDNNEYGRD